MTSYTAHHTTALKHEEKSFQLSPALRKKILVTVILFHFFVIVLPYLTSLIASWFKPHRPPTMIVKLVEGIPGDIGTPAPPNPNPTPVPTPKPPTPKPPTPVPPIIRPQPIVKPIQIRPQPIVKPIRIKPTPPTPPSPQPDIKPLDKDKINEQQYNGVYQGKDPNQTGTVTNPGNNGGGAEKDKYFETLGAYLYPRWREPSKTEMGDRMPSVTVAFTVDSEGRILKSSILRPSGVRPMDNSVMELLRSLTSLPKPPAGLTYFTVEIECQSQ